jgi:hypothetical protein
MKNQSIDKKGKNPAESQSYKKKIGLPLIALGLDFLPVFLIILDTHITRVFGVMYLVMIFLPITGVIVGVKALSQGRDEIGIVGKIIAIIAIVLPIFLIVFLLIFVVGAATGLIAFM